MLTNLYHSRHIRQVLGALCRSYRQRSEVARENVRIYGRHVLERDIDITTQQCRQSCAATSKRHMGHVRPRKRLEQLPGHVDGATYAATAKRHALVLCSLNELYWVGVGAISRHRHHVRNVDQVLQKYKVFHRIVGEIRIDCSADSMAWRGH